MALSYHRITPGPQTGTLERVQQEKLRHFLSFPLWIGKRSEIPTEILLFFEHPPSFLMRNVNQRGDFVQKICQFAN